MGLDPSPTKFVYVAVMGNIGYDEMMNENKSFERYGNNKIEAKI